MSERERERKIERYIIYGEGWSESKDEEIFSDFKLNNNNNQFIFVPSDDMIPNTIEMGGMTNHLLYHIIQILEKNSWLNTSYQMVLFYLFRFYLSYKGWKAPQPLNGLSKEHMCMIHRVKFGMTWWVCA